LAKHLAVAEMGVQRLEELLTTVEFVHVHPDHPLVMALERLGANQLEILPVVSRADVHELRGIVALRDVLASYGVEERGKGVS